MLRTRLLGRAAAALALGAAFKAALCEPVTTAAPPRPFSTWKRELENQLGAEIDLASTLRAHGMEDRTDSYFLWQTLRGERRIKSVSIWRAIDAVEGEEAVSDAVRVTALLELGDQLNGHVGIVHGGFTAAVLDDLLGWVAMGEADAQQLGGAPLTSTLSLRYRRPVFDGRAYQVNARAVSVARRDRPGAPSWSVTVTGELCDERGGVCVEATAVYVVKSFTAAELQRQQGQAHAVGGAVAGGSTEA